MKKLLVAAGISAALMVAQTAAFADGAGVEGAPRVVDRLSAAVPSPDGMVVPARTGPPAAAVTTGTYNSLISQATTDVDRETYLRSLEDYFRCYPLGCGDTGSFGILVLGAVGIAAIVAVTDDSDSD